MSLVTIEGLQKSFKDVDVIKGVGFELAKGKCTALLGPNGAGKTTILKMLSGLMEPTKGRIVFNEAKKGEDIRRLIGYLPQFPVFYEWMSGQEFLEYVAKLAGLTNQLANERAIELLELVGLHDARNRKIGKYSGGMKQRLGIAQALIHSPQLIMLDEPVSALDPIGRREVLQLLEEMKKHTTILFSTHILSDVEEISDMILFLHNGEIVESGSMENLRIRYRQSKIDLHFENNAGTYKTLFEKSNLVQSLTVEGNRLRLTVNDLETARNDFLNRLASLQAPLVKFEISSMTLEDVFMKVVNK